MKSPFRISGLIIISLLFHSCEKDNDNTIKDVDGNRYTSIKIGTQVWMAENLKTTKYKDGKTIPLITNDTVWGVSGIQGYCWYEHDEATYKSDYGALYNWYTANSGRLCPRGWHVPDNDEWEALAEYLGGALVGGGSLKEKGTTHWASPNYGATNESGFTALPGGLRYTGPAGYASSFYGIGWFGNWWSATEESSWFGEPKTENAYEFHLDNNSRTMELGYQHKNNGFSVRCIKN